MLLPRIHPMPERLQNAQKRSWMKWVLAIYRLEPSADELYNLSFTLHWGQGVNYPVGTLWLFKQCAQPSASEHMLSSFTKCPSIWSQCALWVHAGHIVKVPIKVATGYFVKELPGFFHNFVHNVSYCAPEPHIESSFKMYPVMWSKCAQGVLFNAFTMNSQFGWISQQTLKEIIEYIVEYIVATSLGTFWKNSQWVTQAYTG